MYICISILRKGGQDNTIIAWLGGYRNRTGEENKVTSGTFVVTKEHGRIPDAITSKDKNQNHTSLAM